MPKFIEGQLNAANLNIGIVVSRFNSLCTDRLLEAALDAIARHGGDVETTTVLRVPGAFELGIAARKLAETRRCDAVICLGAVIRGETPHFDYVCQQAAAGVQQAMLATGVPMTFGVITADTAEHAMARCGGKAGNKGWEAATAAIEMAQVLRRVEG